MSKVNTLCVIAIALLSVGVAWRFHKGVVQDPPRPTAKFLNASVPSTNSVQGSIEKSMLRESVGAGNSTSANADSNPGQVANTEQPVFDREFASAAAKPYVEAYQREHPRSKNWSFAWNEARVVFVPAPDGSDAKGFLGVFFPRIGSSSVAFTCFNVEDDTQDHLLPISWGYALDITHAIENLRRDAVEGKGCMRIAML